MRERGDLRGRGLGGVGAAVDLGQHGVEDEVVQLFLAADVTVQGTGNYAESGRQRPHAEGLRTIGADDRERLGDDAVTGERTAAALRVAGPVEPQRTRVGSCAWRLLWHAASVPGHG